MANLLTSEQYDSAFAAGQNAPTGGSNPFSQREGEPWFTPNQDLLFDAWRRGYYSCIHVGPVQRPAKLSADTSASQSV
jgi:hypothetical protein